MEKRSMMIAQSDVRELHGRSGSRERGLQSGDELARVASWSRDLLLLAEVWRFPAHAFLVDNLASALARAPPVRHCNSSWRYLERKGHHRSCLCIIAHTFVILILSSQWGLFIKFFLNQNYSVYRRSKFAVIFVL